MTPRLFAFVPFLVASAAAVGGCSSSKRSTGTGNGSGSGSATPIVAAPPVVADAPLPTQPGAAYQVAPLGPPDAIEPPARDIVPGMTIAEARRRGATGADTDITLKWRPDTEVWIDADTGLTTSLQVEYPAATWAEVRARWGAPTFDDDTWVGANWMATLNGCANGPCGVTFVRSPRALLTTAIAPPGAFAALRPGMTRAQIHATCGVPFADSSRVDIGYGLAPSVDVDDDLGFDSIAFDASAGDAAAWLPVLTALWGTPRTFGNDTVWVDPQGAWLAQFDAFGDTVRFVPQTPLAAVLARTGEASVLVAAQATLGKPVATFAGLPGWRHAADAPEDAAGRAHDYGLQPVALTAQTDDAGVVTAVRAVIDLANEADVAMVRGLLTTSLGPITAGQDADDAPVEAITVAGLRVRVEVDGAQLELTLARL